MNFKRIIAVAFGSLLIISCGSSRKIVYFNDIPDGSFKSPGVGKPMVIVPNDILNIHISSLDEEASSMFNLKNQIPSVTTVTSSSPSYTEGGYLVNSDGNIQLPVLGQIKAGGLTKESLRDTIRNRILNEKLLKDPVVEIRFMNYEVTILGEVGKPAVINVPNEKISMLKAIGLAGDLTIFGLRQNVLLIREENGQRITRHIDLTSPDFLSSPYYFLQPNDIVYVQPNRAKVTQATNWTQTAPIFLTALSVAVIVLDRVLK